MMVVTSAPCVTVLLLIWGPVAVPNNNLLPCARHPVLMSPESSSTTLVLWPIQHGANFGQPSTWRWGRGSLLRAVERVKSLPLVELCRVEPVGARGSWWARGKTAADSRLWHLSLEGGKTPVSAQHGVEYLACPAVSAHQIRSSNCQRA